MTLPERLLTQFLPALVTLILGYFGAKANMNRIFVTKDDSKNFVSKSEMKPIVKELTQSSDKLTKNSCDINAIKTDVEVIKKELEILNDRLKTGFQR